MNRRSIFWAVVLALAMLAVGFVAVSQRDARTGVAAGSVSAPANLPQQTRVVAAGRVEPAGEEFLISSEMDGRLARVLVDEGDDVRAGQLVAHLVNTDYRARVELARAEVEASRAALRRLRKGSRDEERQEAEAQLREAQVLFETARKEVDRRRPLVPHGAISRSEFELAAREEGIAKARLDAARQRNALVTNQTRVEDVERADAELASAQARLEELRALLDKTYIRSPINGRVLHRWRKTGESVSAGAATPILSVGDVHTLRVRADIDETDVARIREGQRAYVTADAYHGKRYTGRVVRIGQVLGRKNVRTDEPTERVDKKILETMIELDPGQTLPLGLRVDVFLE